MNPLEGKNVTVMGLGLHGGALGTVNWLLSQKANVTVTDLKTEQELAPTLKKISNLGGVRLVLGEHRPEDFIHADLVIRNPGARRDSEYLKLAYQNNVPVELDSGLFFKYSPTRNIIGVTGSKGKSTTTHAISHLLQLKYPRTITVGSDGASPLGKLSEITADTLVVFELSSWRLEGLAQNSQSPQTAVVTSIYEDHLNTYESFAEYIATKKGILRYQDEHDRAILNADDPIIRSWASEVRGNVYWYSLTNSVPGLGIYIDRGTVTIDTGRGMTSLFSINSLKLKSEHERRNVLPAILLAFLGGIRVESIKLNIGNLQGLAHRLEVVRELRHIQFINDSAATIPDATIAAVNSLHGQPLVLILGGSDKRLKFEKLARVVCKEQIQALIFLPGDATPRLTRQLEGEFGQMPPVYNVKSMEEAVRIAYQVAKPGDTVVLSPGCTSFGLFVHEFERGDKFKAAVNQLV